MKEKTFKKTLELVVCVAYRLRDNPDYTTALLGNSLFLVDYMSYIKTGKPISDLNYVKKEEGIGLNHSQFLQIKDILIKENDVDKTNGSFSVQRDANFEIFDNEEVAIIEEVLNSVSGKSSEVSNYTKSLLAWTFAQHNEEIPFYTFQYNPKKSELQDSQLADKAIKEYLNGK